MTHSVTSNSIPHSSEGGFTLIELSIVLVIIGLIVGGVLVGQDLIRAAETRAIITQLESFNAATNTFRTKYNALPGDMANATTMVPGAVNDGDGTGYIGTGTPPPTPTAVSEVEYAGFYNDLSAAGLVEGNLNGGVTTTVLSNNTTAAANFPATKSGRNGIITYSLSDGLTYHQIGLTNNTADDTLTTADTLRPDEAFNIDTKVDDGFPLTGVVQARGGAVIDAAATSGAGGSAEAVCVNSDTTPNSYNLQNVAPLCQARVRANF